MVMPLGVMYLNKINVKANTEYIEKRLVTANTIYISSALLLHC